MGLVHKSLFFTVCLLAGGLVVGCASTAVNSSANGFSCKRSDWYEIGRRDGSAGLPAKKLDSYRQSCGKRLSADDETLYSNGRNAGLVDYCTSNNAFELGRAKVTYYYVCPSTTEPNFLAAYKLGEKARNLEVQNQKLAAKIEDLSQKLDQQEPQSPKRRDLASQLHQLKRLQARNARELSRISK